jgi:gliding motility-associated-like protein
MRRLLISCLLFLLNAALMAQDPICTSQIRTKYNTYKITGNGYSAINPYSVAYAKSGGYWVGGLVTQSSGNVDFFVSKFDDTGKFLLSTAVGSSSSETGYPIPIFPTRDGGCLVAGRVNSAYELGALSKIDKNGNLAWSRQSPVYRTGVYDAFRGIYVDENSDILAVGTGMQLTGKANLLASLLDSSGKVRWVKNFDFGGTQHHFNAITKSDSIYTLVGWCTFSGGGISPIMAQISESGRFIRSNYYPASSTTTFSDVLVSASKVIYTLGYSSTPSGQHCYITKMKMDGTILWQKSIGYGGDVGNKLLFDQGGLWVSGQSTNLGANKREYFLNIDTSGNLMKYGGLFWDVYGFSSKHQGSSISRSHLGGLVSVGIDDQSSAPHFNIIFGNPCQTGNCGINSIDAPTIQSMSLSRQSLNCTAKDNGSLTNQTLNQQQIPIAYSLNCYDNCVFIGKKLLPSTLTVCKGGNDKVAVDVRNGNYKYLWSNGDTSSKFTFLSPGQFWVKTYNECGSRIDTVDVGGVDSFRFSKLPDSLYCYRNWSYQVNLMPMLETKIAWENGDVNWSRKIATTGKYWYTIQNRCGIWKDTFVISQDSAPKSILPKEFNPCNGNNIQLNGTQAGKSKYQYQWDDGSQSASVWVNSSALKVLKTWNRCGTIIDTVKVVFGECNCNFWVPNAFTPRASRGKNDVWMPVFNCPMDDVKYSIYSRWGECLVRDQSIYVSWDGYYLGDLVPEGLYVYIIHGNYMDPLKGGRSVDKSGTLLVLDGGR